MLLPPLHRILVLSPITVLAGLGVAGSGSRLHAADFPQNTPYYEKDGLLDITEWFDGNDYNPTDEAWWRVDDETYQVSKDTSGDRDSDWYGYKTGNENDWYYDHYDPYSYGYYGYGNRGLYNYGSRYYDYDNDGSYDAITSYTDSDGDGIYDRYDYYSFNDVGNDKQKLQAKDQAAKESKPQSVTGKIEKTKMVKVRGGKQHVVVAITPDNQPAVQKGQMLIVDLGSADDLKSINPKVGDTITAKGPKAIVGQQGVVLARSFETNGTTTQVNRNPRSITGKVLSTHKTKVRGSEHLMAMVETAQKDKTTQQDKMQKVAVDLGQADRLKTTPAEGSSLTFSGCPVKVMVKGKPKTLMMAQSVTQDDKVVQINRQPNNAADSAQPAASKEKRQK